MRRELARSHAFRYGGGYSHYGAYHTIAHHGFGHAAYVSHHGGIVSMIFGWIAHSIVSFAVWHVLGSIFHHFGMLGNIVGGIVCIVLVYFVWKLIRSVATA
jgi:hypothetical protein